GELGAFEVAEHPVIDGPEEEAEEPEARQQVIHDRGDGEDALDVTPVEQDELAELVREAEQAGYEDDQREADGGDHLGPRGGPALDGRRVHHFAPFPFSSIPCTADGW